MEQNRIPYIVAILALAIGAIGLFTPSVPPPIQKVIKETYEKVGASAGPTHYERQEFLTGFSSGSRGTFYATTSSSTLSTYALTSTELCNDNEYIEWNNGVNMTLTSPATTSSAYTCMFAKNEVGATRTYVVYAASSSASATITYAAGTGVDLQEDEGETVVQNGLEVARITFLKKDDSDVIQWVEVGQVGD